jgi:hypothetical protein
MGPGLSDDERRAAVGSRIIREVLRPTLVLGLYLLVLSAGLPAGVSRTFVEAAVLTLAGSAAVAAGVLLFMARRGDRRPARASQPHLGPVDRAYRADAWLLLVPLAPIIQYVAVNDEYLSWTESLRLVLVLSVLTGLVVIVVPYFVQRWMSATVVKALGLSLAFTLFSMPMLARTFSWHRAGNPVAQLAVFVAVFAVSLVLYRRDRIGAYAAAAVYFIAVTLALPVLQTGGAPRIDAASAANPRIAADEYAALRPADMVLRPDIFVLTYDAYVGNETMLQYGIDNSSQEAYLESRDFRIYPGTYTVAAESITSMGRVLGSATPTDGIAGDSPLLDALRASGYHTRGTFKSDYFFRASDPSYDSFFPDVSSVDLDVLQGILQGEFTFDLAFQRPAYEEFLANKRTAFQTELGAPLFIYTHTGPAHSQNSGACLPDEVQLFESRLVTANEEMREDVETILRHRPDAVIIVNGDHGPYLTKNCVQLLPTDYDPSEISRLDIQDRFGTFLAIRWPFSGSAELPEIEILQDVLPAVLSRLYPNADYDALRLPQRLVEGETDVIAGLDIDRGRIVGGPLDGQPLFLGAGDSE